MLKKIDNLKRKLIHLLSAFIICLFPYIFSLRGIIIISLVFAFIFTLARFYNFLPIITKVSRYSWGEVFYPLGVAISAIIFLPDHILAFQFGILVLGLSDFLANIVGDLFGQHRIELLRGAKSLEGSLAFTLSTLALFSIFGQGSSWLILPFSFLLAAVEFSLFLGLDNLLLPSLAAYLFSIL